MKEEEIILKNKKEEEIILKNKKNAEIISSKIDELFAPEIEKAKEFDKKFQEYLRNKKK